jgi:hypothetical protein
MAGLDEFDDLSDGRTPMGSDLFEGLKTLALDQEIDFKLYGRVILPVDNYVFWVRADLLPQKAFAQSGLVTASTLSKDDMKRRTIAAKGSLHYTADFRQEEAENYAGNRMLFTSTQEVQDLNAIAPGTMWIGSFGKLRFGFSALAGRFVQAGIWHYSGFAIYPDMEPQIIDSAQAFSSAQIVSNSLPAWLAIAGYFPPWAFWGPLPTLFPSFLVPDNEAPPFGSVHIIPESTIGLASAPTIDPTTSSHTQLCSERVRITLWGLNNQAALDFVDAVYRYSSDTGNIGIMNIPVIRDEKRTQSELRTIAQKKSMEIEVSYLQSVMRNVATQVIKSCIPTIYIGGRGGIP